MVIKQIKQDVLINMAQLINDIKSRKIPKHIQDELAIELRDVDEDVGSIISYLVWLDLVKK